jgi:hypothetical protein
MTQKEKADELIGKFMMLDTHDEDPFIIRQNRAKQCALIAVDEILNNDGFTQFDIHLTEFWQEVKQEIEKL